jgi:hypothetical protein
MSCAEYLIGRGPRGIAETHFTIFEYQFVSLEEFGENFLDGRQ